MVSIDLLAMLAQMIFFPALAVAIWIYLFNSKNPWFSKAIIELSYLLIGIPLVIILFLLVPVLALTFWAANTRFNPNISYGFIGLVISLTIIFQYYYLKKAVNGIEAREKLPILKVISNELSRKKKTNMTSKDDGRDFYAKIQQINEVNRTIKAEEANQLHHLLLGESDEAPDTVQ